MTVIAGVDVGNATTEVVLMSGGVILGAGRAPTRGRKGSADSLRGAAALVRRVERQAGRQADEARIAPLRAVDTSVVTVPDTAPPRGRLRVLAAGVPTPGGTGACVGAPLLLPAAKQPPGDAPLVAVIPPGLRYDEAAARLRALLAAGTPIGAVLVAGDEGVLVANRLPASLPVIDQVDADAAASTELLAVEVRPPGHALNMLTDPVALGARLALADDEAADTAVLGRALADYSNAVVVLLPAAPGPAAPAEGEHWVMTADGCRIPLREACPRLAEWPVGTVRILGAASGPAEVDDLFAVDLAAAAEASTARQGSTGRAVLVASLARVPGPQAIPHGELLGELLSVPVRSPATEPAASRLGALTTPGARPDAVVVDLGAGTIDVIGADCDVVAAGAGELLTAAVAETLGIPRAAAELGQTRSLSSGRRRSAIRGRGRHAWFPGRQRPSLGHRHACGGQAGLLPFDRRHGPGEWRAIRLRLKVAVLARNIQRAVRSLGWDPGQVLVVGGPAGDEELLGVLARSLPAGVAVGRGDLGRTCEGEPLGHRYAVAVGLALGC